MHLPINLWMGGAAVTVAGWWYAMRLMRQHSGGDYNFAPAIFFGVALAGTATLWLGILLVWFLR